MNQNVWGKHLWIFLHSLTLNYPIDPKPCDKERTNNFFMLVQEILPCKFCRENYKRNLNEFPIRLNSRKDLFQWLIDIHNEVNGLTGKRHYSYDEVINIYEKMYGKKISLNDDRYGIKEEDEPCYFSWKHNFLNFLIILLFVLGLIYFLKKYYRKK